MSSTRFAPAASISLSFTTATLDGVSRSVRGTRSPVTMISPDGASSIGTSAYDATAAAISEKHTETGMNPPVLDEPSVYTRDWL